MRLSLKKEKEFILHAFSLGKENNLPELVTRGIGHLYCARWLALENVRLQKIVSMA